MKRTITSAIAIGLLSSVALAQGQTQPQTPSQGQSQQPSGQSQPPAARSQSGSGSGQSGSGSGETQQQGTQGQQQQRRDAQGDQKPAQPAQAPQREQRRQTQDQQPQQRQGSTPSQTAPGQQPQREGAAPATGQQQQGTAPSQTSPGQQPQQQAGAQLTSEQRTQMRQSVQTVVQRNEVNRVQNVNITISVGVVVPDTIRGRLRPVPVTLVSINPAYRNYQVVVIEDDFIIVEPATYKVVEVISLRGDRQQASRVEINLNQEQIAFIRTNIVVRDRAPDVRVRLALGAEVPASVTLVEFPSVIVERIPELKQFKYVVVERDLAICDPNSREVVQVVQL